MPAGGLSEDGTEWIRAHKKFLVPVKVLSRVFRGVFWSLLEKQLLKQKVKLPDDIPNLSVLKDLVYKKAWNVYAKKPLGSSKSAVEYLGKYTHRVAISNSRLIKMEDGKINFKWKDYRTTGNRKLMTLSTEEFIRRFMQHILPSGFYKIRYYGLLASANGAVRQHCAMLIGRVQPVYCKDYLPDWYLKSFQAKIRSGGTRIAAQNVSRVK
nr:transposase [Flexithrix dorotheae]